jgi:hypothetical protein
MQDTTTQPVRDENRPGSPAPLSLPPPLERGRIAGTFNRLKTTLDEGESLWTPCLVLGLSYAITIPAFLLMLAVAELAYYLRP